MRTAAADGGFRGFMGAFAAARPQSLLAVRTRLGTIWLEATVLLQDKKRLFESQHEQAAVRRGAELGGGRGVPGAGAERARGVQPRLHDATVRVRPQSGGRLVADS